MRDLYARPSPESLHTLGGGHDEMATQASYIAWPRTFSVQLTGKRRLPFACGLTSFRSWSDEADAQREVRCRVLDRVDQGYIYILK